MNQFERVFDLIIGIGFNALIILVLLSLKGKIDLQKKRLSILSLISTIIFTIIPTIGYRADKDSSSYYFGFPADGFFYRDGGDLTIASLGLSFNFFFYYWIFKLIWKIWKPRSVQ